MARELQGGNTGHDVINALDNAVMGPTYRAGLMRHWALEKLRAPREASRTSAAWPSRTWARRACRKLLHEADLLRRAFGTMAAVRAAHARRDGAPRRRPRDRGRAPRRREIVSIGIPILLPDGRLLRGPECKIPPVPRRPTTPSRSRRSALEAWAGAGWVDLREANMARWKRPLRRASRPRSTAIPARDTSSRFLRDRQFWGAEGIIQPGKVVGWIFAHRGQGRADEVMATASAVTRTWPGPGCGASSWITLLLNLVVSGSKIAVGKLSGSLSMVADGYHSLMDGSNNVIGLVVTAFAYAPPDEGHPYGHRKFETAATLFIGLALLGLAYNVVDRTRFGARRPRAPARDRRPQLGGHGRDPGHEPVRVRLRGARGPPARQRLPHRRRRPHPVGHLRVARRHRLLRRGQGGRALDRTAWSPSASPPSSRSWPCASWSGSFHVLTDRAVDPAETRSPGS